MTKCFCDWGEWPAPGRGLPPVAQPFDVPAEQVGQSRGQAKPFRRPTAGMCDHSCFFSPLEGINWKLFRLIIQ